MLTLLGLVYCLTSVPCPPLDAGVFVMQVGAECLAPVPCKARTATPVRTKTPTPTRTP